MKLIDGRNHDRAAILEAELGRNVGRNRDLFMDSSLVDPYTRSENNIKPVDPAALRSVRRMLP